MATNLVGEINSRNGVHGVRAINGSCDIDHANSTKGYKGVDNVKGIKGSSNISGPITVHATHDVSTTELETTVSGLFSTNSIDGENLGKGYIDHAKHSNPLASTHSLLVYKLFQKLQAITRDGNVKVNGESLDVPTVVAVSKYDIAPNLDDSPEFKARIAASVALLNHLLSKGKTIYGVNTGYGGSADTRSNRNEDLQSALLQHHHFGVLTTHDRGLSGAPGDHLSSQAMPQPWVKGTMLVRCNSIARGHSALSLHVIETIIALLRNNLTPVIPLRGSISASGDLSPLSYVAGTVTGNPDIYVRTPSGIVPAQQALQQLNIAPITLGPKEGLGLMNGTATSAAVGSLVLYETHQLFVLSQTLSAMALEALLGTAENYDSFIAEVRPHRGQMESARNIRHFLQGSRLARGLDHHDDTRQSPGLLYQDRYALRTAAQWIGPQLEDLLLAHEQVTTELNSTTDNPLVDVAGHKTHHGGNFQAVSVTSAMEKIRLSLQMLGKMLFAQCSELINPMLNNGLPPNLAADEPSLSFTMKGVDIGMASYMSELAFLANPVSSHVQSAEMHNQAINSLAFISARYTFQAVDLVSLMSASYLYTVCQALDLRVLQMIYFQNLEPALYAVNDKIFGHLLSDADFGVLHMSLWEHTQVTWLLTASKDSEDRYAHLVDSALAVVMRFFISCPNLATTTALDALPTWQKSAFNCLAETYSTTRIHFFERQNTADYLGHATRKVYIYVRRTLGVPLHQGLQDHPTPKDKNKKLTIGSWIAVIYEALRDGRLHAPLMESLVEAEAATTATQSVADKVGLFNGWVGFDGDKEAVESGHEEQREVAIMDGKRRDSVASVVSDSARRRSSLAVARGSLTGF